MIKGGDSNERHAGHPDELFEILCNELRTVSGNAWGGDLWKFRVNKGELMSTVRRPGLDLIRATAILLVVFHHYRHMPGCPEWLSWLSLRGYIGVDLFFVLSGWLIGGQLARQYHLTGQVEIFRFWTRRWFRTLPCYFAILAVFWHFDQIAVEDFPAFFFFLQNYITPGSWLISWSLCVEEHFYIVLPLLFLLLPLIVRSKVDWWLIGLVLIFISPLMRYLALDQVLAVGYGTFIRNFYGVTHLRLEGLAIGVGLAIIAEYRTSTWLWIERHAGKLALAGATMVVVATWPPQLTGNTAAGAERMGFFPWVMGFFFVSIGTGTILPLANRLTLTGLWVKPVTILSEHAYTMYLVHEFCRDIILHCFNRLSFSGYLTLAMGLSLATAAALRFTVEVPGLKVRDRMLRWRPTPKHRRDDRAVAEE